MHKAFGSGNKIENVPDALKPFETFIKSDEPSKWIGWQIKGNEFLKLGDGEQKSAGRQRPSILADALEAIIGAVYIESGHLAAESLVLKLYADKLNTIDPKIIDKDAKSQLQELLQSKKIELPDYQVTQIEGEAHAQTFQVTCNIVKLNVSTLGEGTSRRAAEQDAAKIAFEQIVRLPH